jgi:prepilin-type N-terminal cleavage/methylation domain-containing protein
MNKIKNKKFGFTLLELLVVVAIIGILVTVIIVSINSARAKGRDAKRMSDIQQINTAIQLYILTNGVPPNLGNPSCGNIANYDPSCFASSGKGLANWNILATELQPFLKILPTDPCPTCVATEPLILNAFAAAGISEYIYHAPAAVNAYLVGKGINSSQAGLTEHPYSIFTTNLEGKSLPFGFGLSVSAPQSNDDGGGTTCPYEDDYKCKLWAQCSEGNTESCKELSNLENVCPYLEDKNAEEICRYWDSCNAKDQEACSWLEKNGYSGSSGGQQEGEVGDVLEE